MSDGEGSNRRRFQRVRAPIFCRPSGMVLFSSPATEQPAIDVSQGGLRVYTDEALKVGARLEIELFLPDATSVTCEVRVVWLDPLKGGVARFEAGLEFSDIAEADRQRLAVVLEQHA